MLVEALGFKPKLAESKSTVLPLHYTSLVPVARFELARFWHSVLSRARLPFHHTGMVLSAGNDPTFLALQASTLTISVKIAFGCGWGTRTLDLRVMSPSSCHCSNPHYGAQCPDWTDDLLLTRQLLYHWANPAEQVANNNHMSLDCQLPNLYFFTRFCQTPIIAKKLPPNGKISLN